MRKSYLAFFSRNESLKWAYFIGILRLSCWCMWVGKMNRNEMIRPKIRPRKSVHFQLCWSLFSQFRISSALFDSLNRLQHIVKAFIYISHNNTASLTTRSRIRSLSPRSVTTSTFDRCHSQHHPGVVQPNQFHKAITSRLAYRGSWPPPKPSRKKTRPVKKKLPILTMRPKTRPK